MAGGSYRSHVDAVDRAITRRVLDGMDVNGQRGKTIAKAGTPVDTRWAQNSVQCATYNGAAFKVRGDDTDGNSLPVTHWPFASGYEKNGGRLTTYVGSNTNDNPIGQPGGYYTGLELGIYSRKGSHMLATALADMSSNLMDDIAAEVRKGP